MRISFFIFLFALSMAGASQSNFDKQIKALIADTTGSFQGFKGLFKELYDKDSIFYSKITIEGTNKNDILFANGMNMYRATIIDSVNERKGKNILEKWKQKLGTALDSRFQCEQLKIVYWNPAKFGWKFKYGNIWVDITLYPYSHNSSSLYWSALGITYLNGENIIQ